MRITWLLEVADQLWGGVKVALENANWLQRHGHQVTVVSRSRAPAWMRLECAFQQVQDFHAEHLPDGDVIIGTFWTTVPWAASAGPGKGVPVHFCQGYEGDNQEQSALRERIEAAYRLPGVAHITIAPHLTRLLQERFGVKAHEVRYAIDHGVHFPGEARTPGSPLRIGLVGPAQVAWKGLETGYAACRLLQAAGQQFVLVRATNTEPTANELAAPFPIEWHRQVPPASMGNYYRSLDVLMVTSGPEEGFFLPAIEAMACGVPTVLTDVPCFRDHAAVAGNDRYALFVPPANAGETAQAVVIASSLPEVRTALRSAGLELAAHYHQDHHGEQFVAALAEIVAQRAQKALRAPMRLVGQPERPVTRSPDTDLEQLRQRLQAAAAKRTQDGDLGAAARALTAAHHLSPDDRELLHAAADANLTAGAPDQALQMWDRLVDQGVEAEALHTGRGHALHALGRMHDAAQAFRAALAVGDRSASAHNRLGVVLFQAGDVAGARAEFERALMLQPDHGDARANLAALPAA